MKIPEVLTRVDSNSKERDQMGNLGARNGVVKIVDDS